MEARLKAVEEEAAKAKADMEIANRENAELRRRLAEKEKVDDREGGETSASDGHPEGEETRGLCRMVQDLMSKYEELSKKVHTSPTVENLLSQTDLPYSERVMAVPLPPKFKTPQMECYDGTKDPVDHVENFKAHMALHDFPNEVACRAFPLTLKGTARAWFATLKPSTIDCFDDLAKLFLTQFMPSRRRRRNPTYLLSVKQRPEESLRAYLTRFNEERLTVEEKDEQVTLTTLMGGVWPRSPFMKKLAGRMPATLREFMDRADAFINTQDTLQALWAPFENSKRDEHRKGRFGKGGGASRRDREPERRMEPPRRTEHNYQTEGREARDRGTRHEPEKKPYCEYHRSTTHWAEECGAAPNRRRETRGAKGDRGKWPVPPRRQEFKDVGGRGHHPPTGYRGRDRQGQEGGTPQKDEMEMSPVRVIQTIAGGLASGGPSASGRKAYARRARYDEVYLTDEVFKRRRTNDPTTITFGEADGEGILFPHNDALVVTIAVGANKVRRVLVDNGSSADILFWHAFEKMGIEPDRLKAVQTPLKGFTGDVVQPVGAITLSVVAGTGSKKATTMADFLVVKAQSSYNVILGRPTLNRLRAVTSTHYLKMKFPTACGVGEVRGEQALARECYVQELRK